MEIWFRIGVARNLVPVVITFFRSDQRNHFFFRSIVSLHQTASQTSLPFIVSEK